MKKFLIVFLVLLISTNIFAIDYNVGIYQNDDIFDLYSFCENSINTKFTLTEMEKARYETLANYQKTLIANQNLVEKYANPTKIITEKKATNLEYKLNISYKKLDDKVDLTVENTKLLEQIGLTENLSLILISNTTNISNFIRYRVYAYDLATLAYSTIYDKLLKENEKNIDQEDLMEALLPVFYNNYCLVTLIGDPDKETLAGNKIFAGKVIVSPGEYTISDKTFTVKDEKELSIDLTKEINSQKSVYFNSKVGTANLLFNNQINFTTPLYMEKIDLPFTVKVSKEGFMPSQFQIVNEKDNFDFKLRPAWLNELNNYELARKDFYKAFALSLGIYSLRVVANSLNELNPTLYSGINTVLYGLSFVNLFNCVDKLFNYYYAGEEIAP